MKGALAFGVDIGGSRTKIAIVEINGNIIDRKIFSMVEFRKLADYNRFVTSLCECILDFMNIYADYQILGIGIGAPNANHLSLTIDNPVNLWRDDNPNADSLRIFELASDIKRNLEISGTKISNIKITNDANAAALGELFYGGAKNLSDFMVVTLGTGVGGGIVINKKLLEGANSKAGEIGHMKINLYDRLCGCGAKGCLETYASANGICRTTREWLAEYKYQSSLSNIPVDKLSCADICEAARNGDILAKNVFEFTGGLLGKKLADVILLLDLEAVFITGGVANAGEFMIETVRNAIYESLPNSYHNIIIKLSEINDDFAAAKGAASMILSDY